MMAINRTLSEELKTGIVALLLMCFAVLAYIYIAPSPTVRKPVGTERKYLFSIEERFQTDLDNRHFSTELRHALEERFLFSVDLESFNALNAGKISAALQEKFKNQQIMLTRAKVNVEASGVKWRIHSSSTQDTYPIRKEGAQLSVYQHIFDRELSESVRVSVEEQGRRWVIIDPDYQIRYEAQKTGPEIKVYQPAQTPEFIGSVESKFQSDFDNQSVPESLHAALENAGIRLPHKENLKITVKEKGHRWLLEVTDKKRKRWYRVQKVGDELNGYKFLPLGARVKARVKPLFYAENNTLIPLWVLKRLGVSVVLIGGSLLVSLLLSIFVGGLAATDRRWGTLKILMTLLSAIPVYITAGCVANTAQVHNVLRGAFFSPVVSLIRTLDAVFPAKDWLWAILILGLGNLAIAVLSRDVYTELSKELRQWYIRTAKVKGAPLWKHYSPRLAIVLCQATRPLITIYLSASIIVERKLDVRGIGHLAHEAALGQNGALLGWVCFISLTLVVWPVSLMSRSLARKFSREPEMEESETHELNPRLFELQFNRSTLKRLKTILSQTPKNTLHRIKIGLPYLWSNCTNYINKSRLRWMTVILFFTLAVVNFGILVGGISGWLPAETEGVFTDSTIKDRKPDSEFYLGTDQDGHNVLRLLIMGSRAYIFPALVGLLAAVMIGIPLAMLREYANWRLKIPFTQRKVDVIHPLVETLDSLPKLMILIAVVLITTRTGDAYYQYKIMATIGILFVPDIYYNVGERIQYFKSKGFIEASRALGASDASILLTHILWNNCKSVVLIRACYIMGNFILFDSMLHYLKVVNAEETWGNQITSYFDPIQAGRTLENWWAFGAPAVAIILAIAFYNFLGDALRILLNEESA